MNFYKDVCPTMELANGNKVNIREIPGMIDTVDGKVDDVDNRVDDVEEDIKPIPYLIDDTVKNKLDTITLDLLKRLNPEGTWVNNVYTVNGITFVIVGDGSIIVTGTSTALTQLKLVLPKLTAGVKYSLSGCPSGGSSSSYRLVATYTRSGSSTTTMDTGNGNTFTYQNTDSWSTIAIVISSGTTMSTKTFKPMICANDVYAISTNFVPYTPPVGELYSMMNWEYKNLLHTKARSGINGNISWAVNDNGWIIVNGTNNNSGDVTIVINQGSAGTLNSYLNRSYVISGCPYGGSDSTYYLQIFQPTSTQWSYARDTGSSRSFTVTNSSREWNVAIVIKSGVTVSNLVFKPMICTAEAWAMSNKYVPNYQGLKSVVVKVSLTTSGLFTQSGQGLYYSSNMAVSGLSRIVAVTLKSFEQLRASDVVLPYISDDGTSLKLSSNTNSFANNNSTITVVCLGYE